MDNWAVRRGIEARIMTSISYLRYNLLATTIETKQKAIKWRACNLNRVRIVFEFSAGYVLCASVSVNVLCALVRTHTHTHITFPQHVQWIL